uniref:Uncharacterized protein n=1 Tax=Lepeophtheirus salmonis TaxID=72036 RepID=A0A0K2T6D8_LEPSM
MVLSKIENQNRSNSCFCPCLFSSPPPLSSQLIVADLFKRHDR